MRFYQISTMDACKGLRHLAAPCILYAYEKDMFLY